MAVHFIGMYVYCAWYVHQYCSSLPLVFTSTCACPLHAAICQLSSSNYPAPLDPLVDSLVACQRLTSLELRDVSLSFQRFLAVVKGMHNLRALGLERVQFQDHLFEVCLHKLKTISCSV